MSRSGKSPQETIFISSSDSEEDQEKVLVSPEKFVESISISTPPPLGFSIKAENQRIIISEISKKSIESIKRFPVGSSILAVGGISTEHLSVPQVASLLLGKRPVVLKVECQTFKYINKKSIYVLHTAKKLGITVEHNFAISNYVLVVGFHDDVNPIILQNVPLKARITSVNNITTKNKHLI